MALSVEKISLSYGSRLALSDVSLHVGSGELVALIGANGAGKSSTLRAIMGLNRISSGQVLHDGEPISGRPTNEIVRRGIALSPEGRRVFPLMTVEECLDMGAYTRKNRAEIAQSLEQVYGYFPRLAERRLQLAGSMSGGEQQMLAIGRALMAAPKILLLDEPSLGLAPVRIQEIVEIINRIRQEKGLSIILVEQNANLALKICDRAYVLENGAISLQGSGAELAASDHVRKAYLGM